MALWLDQEIFQSFESQPGLLVRQENLLKPMKGFSLDTRTLQPGDLFISISGSSHQGHSFLQEAYKKGAVGAMVPGDKEKFAKFLAPGLPLIVVRDVHQALQTMARYRRHQSRAVIGAVTGSVGKTTLTQTAARLLEPYGSVGRTLKNYNGYWGLPISMASMERHCNFGVFEIGIDRPGSMEALTNLLEPDSVLITYITGCHQENFSSLEALSREKANIFKGLAPQQGGSVILPNTLLYEEEVLGVLKSLDLGPFKGYTYGLSKTPSLFKGLPILQNHELYLQSISKEASSFPNLPTWNVEFTWDGKIYNYQTHWGSPHHLMNQLGALCLVHSLTKDFQKSLPLLKDWAPQPGRGSLMVRRSLTGGKGSPLVILDETYNSSLASVKASLQAVESLSLPPKVPQGCVLGPIKEQGEATFQTHRSLLEILKTSSISHLWLLGKEFEPHLPFRDDSLKVFFFDTYPDLEESVLSHLDLLGAVLIKGSRAACLERLVKAICQLTDPWPKEA